MGTRYMSHDTKARIVSEILKGYSMGKELPAIKHFHVSDPEKAKELERVAKGLSVMLEFTLDDRIRKNVKINTTVLDHRHIVIDITKTTGDLNAMIHGQLYDPLIYAMLDIRGSKIDKHWGIRITIYILRSVDKRQLQNRLLDLLKRIIELESTYF